VLPWQGQTSRRAGRGNAHDARGRRAVAWVAEQRSCRTASLHRRDEAAKGACRSRSWRRTHRWSRTTTAAVLSSSFMRTADDAGSRRGPGEDQGLGVPRGQYFRPGPAPLVVGQGTWAFPCASPPATEPTPNHKETVGDPLPGVRACTFRVATSQVNRRLAVGVDLGRGRRQRGAPLGPKPRGRGGDGKAGTRSPRAVRQSASVAALLEATGTLAPQRKRTSLPGGADSERRRRAP